MNEPLDAVAVFQSPCVLLDIYGAYYLTNNWKKLTVKGAAADLFLKNEYQPIYHVHSQFKGVCS